jgi:hypothetical protein
MLEKPCKAENDIIIPERCCGKSEAKKCIKAGEKAVYDAINFIADGSVVVIVQN